MKNLLKQKEMVSRNHLLELWEKYSNLVGSDQDDDETIVKENLLIGEIESLMQFKNREEHEHWLDVLQGYKFWEDFEELTLSIIKRTTENKLKTLIDHYYHVLEDVCRDSNFYDLFNTFMRLSNGWVKPMTEWNIFYKSMANDDNLMGTFHEIWKEIYEKSYDYNDLKKMNYYGFEDTPCCQFYKNDEESKNELINAIMERYSGGLKDDEKLWFFQRMIKELI